MSKLSSIIPTLSISESNKSNKISKESAVALGDDELACYYAVKYVLGKHNLTETEQNYGSNYISSFYVHSYSEKSKTTTKIFTDKHLLQFLVYADLQGICKFALSYNTILDNSIKTHNNALLKQLLLSPKEIFLELYDNPLLQPQDFDYLTKLLEREFLATDKELQLLKEKILTQEIINDLNTCHTEELIIAGEISNSSIISGLTIKCYDEVCLLTGRNAIEAQKYEKPSDTVFTIDNPQSTPQKFCFKLLDLLDLMTTSNPINPQTTTPFSDFTIKLVKQRFHKELAMYQRYKQIATL